MCPEEFMCFCRVEGTSERDTPIKKMPALQDRPPSDRERAGTVLRGVLIAAIDDYIASNNKNPKPFVWTATAELILERGMRDYTRAV